MLYYYYIYLLVALGFVFILLRLLYARKRDISVDFFLLALRNENDGNFEQAVITYEKALTETKKRRFHNKLRTKIIEKVKVLHTVIEYQNSTRFIRQEA